MQATYTIEQFLSVFERYNQTIWPMHVIAYILLIAAIWLSIRRTDYSDRGISGILAFVWLWVGVFFFGLFLSQISPMAIAFGTLFVLQSVLFFGVGVVWKRLTFRAGADWISTIGSLLMGYALVVYPIIGTLVGHGYPYLPLVGVAPCPTTIFTFGLLLWTRTKAPRYLLVVPFIWGMMSLSAAINYGVVEDFVAPVAALLGVGLLLWRDRTPTARLGPRAGYA